MARVKDLWHSEVPDPSDPEGKRKIKRKTARHPDNGGSKTAKRWLAIWIGPDSKEESKAFRIQDAAIKYARKQEEDIDRDEYIDRKAGKALFGPLARRWLRLRDVGANTAARYESTLRLHVEPVFAKRQVKSVRPSEVREWLLELAKTHGSSTQAIAYLIVSGTFDLAVADGMRKDNPARSPIVPTPKQEQTERESWHADRVWSVIDVHPDQYRAIPITAAGCGLREGEAFALAEEDFDFEAGTVRIGRQLGRVGKRMVFKLPKGGKARTVPLPRGVAAAVQAHIEAYPPRPYELPWLDERGNLADEPHVCRLLFRWHGDDPRTHDRHIQPYAYDRNVWKPALAAAGIIPPPAKGPKGGVYRRHVQDREDGTHALRHYYSTTLQDAGVSLAGVMEFLGHSRKGARLPVTVGVYGHVTEETFEAARVAVDRSLFRLRPVQDHSAGGTEAEQAAGT
jgi:integrase